MAIHYKLLGYESIREFERNVTDEVCRNENDYSAWRSILPNGECTQKIQEIQQTNCLYASADWGSTGLISTTGVPSIASIGPTFSLSPAMARTVTRCKPSGFGRSGDRVAGSFFKLFERRVKKANCREGIFSL